MKRTVLLLMGALLCGAPLMAADEVSRDVTVELDYNPTIGQVTKQVLTPEKEEFKADTPQVKYATWSKVEEVELPVNKQRAIDADVNRKYDYKKGTFKAGLGFYWQVLGEFYYPLLQGDSYLLDVDVKHHSNWSKIALEDGTTPRGMSNYTDVALTYEHQFDNASLSMQADYAYTGYDYYGMSTEPITPFYKDTIGTNSAFNFEASLQSTNPKKSFQYNVALDYLYFGRNFDISMHEVGFEGDFSGKAGTGRMGAEVEVDVHLLAMQEHPMHNVGVLKIAPYYGWHGRDWELELGANLFAHIAEGENPWPVSGSANIKAHAGIVPELFYLYVGITGDYSSNDYYSILRENKYITPTLSVAPTYTPFDANLGLKVRIMKGLLFDVDARYQLILDQYYFVNHTDESVNQITGETEAYYTNTFDVVYEPTTHHLSVGAGLYFDYVKGLDMSVNARYNMWSVTQEAYAWHKPTWEIGFKGTYNFLEKWQVGASYTYLGGRMAKVQGEAKSINDLHDVNVWASYKALDWLSVFVEGKNLANIQSDVFYGYRSFGINAMAGVTFSF